MNGLMGVAGFGDVTATDAAVISQAAKPSVIDNISNILTKVVQPAAQVYSTVKTNSGGGSSSSTALPGYQPAQVVSSNPLPVAEPSNAKKYLLIGGVIVLAGTGIYFATRKKKK